MRIPSIHAAGELQASSSLGEAAKIMSVNPVAIQLRYLQTLSELAGEKEREGVSAKPWPPLMCTPPAR